MMSDKRSLKQNKSIHLYFTQLSEALNDAGYSVTKVMKHDAEIPWSSNLVKELLWRQVQEIMTDVESTANLEPKQISEVYEVVNRHIAQTTGVSVPFPDNYSQSLRGE